MKMFFLLSSTFLVFVSLCHARGHSTDDTTWPTPRPNTTQPNMSSSLCASSPMLLCSEEMVSTQAYTSTLTVSTYSSPHPAMITSTVMESSFSSTVYSVTPTESSGLTSPVPSGSSMATPSSGLMSTTSTSSSSSSLSSNSTAASSVLPTSPPSSEGPTTKEPPTKDPPTNNIPYLSVGIAGGVAFVCSLVLCGIVVIIILVFRKGRQKDMSDVNEKSSATIKFNAIPSSKAQSHKNQFFSKLSATKMKTTSLMSTNEDQHAAEQKEKDVPTYEEVKPQITTGEEQMGQPKTRTDVDPTVPSEEHYKSLETAELDYTHMYSVVKNEMLLEPQVLGVEVDGKVYAVVNKRYTNSQNQYASLDQSLRELCYETTTCDKQ